TDQYHPRRPAHTASTAVRSLVLTPCCHGRSNSAVLTRTRRIGNRDRNRENRCKSASHLGVGRLRPADQSLSHLLVKLVCGLGSRQRASTWPLQRGYRHVRVVRALSPLISSYSGPVVMELSVLRG